MNTYQITLTFTEPLLGTVPLNREVYADYIASRVNNVEALDEVETIEEATEKGTTGFHRLDGAPAIYDYAVKGLFKDATSMLRRVPGTASAKLTAYKKIIDGLVFVTPRLIPLTVAGELGILERPLRAQTAQGERVSLARSEMARLAACWRSPSRCSARMWTKACCANGWTTAVCVAWASGATVVMDVSRTRSQRHSRGGAWPRTAKHSNGTALLRAALQRRSTSRRSMATAKHSCTLRCNGTAEQRQRTARRSTATARHGSAVPRTATDNSRIRAVRRVWRSAIPTRLVDEDGVDEYGPASGGMCAAWETAIGVSMPPSRYVNNVASCEIEAETY